MIDGCLKLALVIIYQDRRFELASTGEGLIHSESEINTSPTVFNTPFTGLSFNYGSQPLKSGTEVLSLPGSNDYYGGAHGIQYTQKDRFPRSYS